jgi:flagellar motility protein MotE (MotC chaperone)
VNKKMIIITIALGVISFAGLFTLGMLTKNQPQRQQEPQSQLLTTQAGTQTQTQSQTQSKNPFSGQKNDSIPAVQNTTVTISMSEQQLNNLIQDLRLKMLDYEQRLEALNDREHRLQIAQDVLKQDLNKLTVLQTELASITSGIKSEQEKLLKSKLEINQIEKSNLVQIAGTYDKMDATSASKILANMCTAGDSKTQQGLPTAVSGAGYDDAVRILYYMTERTKAKLLAEMAASEPQLASTLSLKLKQIAEVK